MSTLFIPNLPLYESLLTVVGIFQLKAKADAIAEPILKEVTIAEEGLGGEGGNINSGRGATERAPAPEDQTMGGSSRPAASKV